MRHDQRTGFGRLEEHRFEAAGTQGQVDVAAVHVPADQGAGTVPEHHGELLGFHTGADAKEVRQRLAAEVIAPQVGGLESRSPLGVGASPEAC